ncbi:MAG: ATP-binding protein, partial [Bacteroidota bacterium]
MVMLPLETRASDEAAVLILQDSDERLLSGSLLLDPYLQVLPDSAGDFVLEDVLTPRQQARFSSAYLPQLDSIRLEVAAYWLRLEINHQSPVHQSLLVNFSVPYVDWYLPTSDSTWRRERSGILLPFEERPFLDQYQDIPMLPLELPPHHQGVYYARVQIDPSLLITSSQLRPYNRVVVKPAVATQKLLNHHLFVVLVMGITLTVAIYHLILFFYNRDRRFWVLSMYNLSLFLLNFSFNGYVAEFFFSQNLELYHRFNGLILFTFSGVTSVALLRGFAETREHFPRWDRAMQVLLIGHLLILGTGFLFALVPTPESQAIKTGVVSFWFAYNLLGDIISIILFFYVTRKGLSGAWVYLVAFLILVINVYAFIFDYVGVWQTAFGVTISDYLPQDLGVALHDLILAFGLAASFKALQDAKFKAETEQRLAQEKVLRQLEKVDQLKDQFLANTSHELRTPLNGIIGLSESIEDRLEDPELKEDLGMIIASGKRLSALVNDILDFAKLRNEGILLRKRPLDLHTMVSVVRRINLPLIKGRQLELVNQIPQDFPWVSADEDRLQQILFNLVGNAVKFTEEGRIEVKAEEREGEAIISVRDTGIGIAPEKHEVIFEAFQQADGSISRAFSGTGLGLSITKHLVDLHEGRIWVESELGKGSTFFLALPLADQEPRNPVSGSPAPVEVGIDPLPPARMAEFMAEASGEKESAESPLSNQGSPSLAQDLEGNIRVLIIDDEPINHQVLKNFLQGESIEIISAMNGKEALKVIHGGDKFDLILLDLMMPQMSGYEVCEKIRAQYLPSQVPVIMVTAKNQEADMVEGFSIGANDYIVKPFRKDEFLARVKTHLNLHRIHAATGRFVPYEFIQVLGRQTITDVRLGDQVERELTGVFTDIRDYTGIAEQLTPEENFAFVNTYAGEMGPIISAHHGFVNQYMGDGIMAIFMDQPEDSLKACIAMQRAIPQMGEAPELALAKGLRVGMGIHLGDLIMGIIGDQQRTDAATISDTVNVASRIEGLTKHYGASILLSEDVVRYLPADAAYAIRYLGPVLVKGKKTPIGLYECFDGDSPSQRELKMTTLPLFKQGLDHYFARRFNDAVLALKGVLDRNPQDIAARRFIQ